MSQIVGTWKLDRSTYQNFDAFWKETGAADEMVEKFRTAETTIIVKKDGDMWQYTIKSSLIPEKTIHFKSGEEVVTDLMGKGIKFTITDVSDTKQTQVETAEMMGWKPLNIVREVKGDTMYSSSEVNGVTMHVQYKRC